MRFSCPSRLKKKSCHRVIANESGGVTIRTMRSRRKCTQVRRIKPEEGRLLPENGRGMQRLRTGLQRVRRRTSLSPEPGKAKEKWADWRAQWSKP